MASKQSKVIAPPQPCPEVGDVTDAAATGSRQPGVLVVDDDPVLLALLKVALARNGFEVWEAKSGAEAIQTYQREQSRINIVLLDVRMPGQDGPRTLVELQRINAAVTCCFMSGYTGDYSLADLLNCGAVHFFEKPFRMDEIVRVLGCLAQEQAEREATSA
jgi:DNA-binding NtrC family response regulator